MKGRSSVRIMVGIFPLLLVAGAIEAFISPSGAPGVAKALLGLCLGLALLGYIALASHGVKHLKQQTIASIEAGLDPDRFVRIHRSYIVNFERVVRIEPYGKDSRLAILADNTRLPVSRAGYARLKTLLEDRA